jgi:tetratricopeptide (TPR) repeat protein
MAVHYPPYTTSYWRAELLYQNNKDDEAIRWFQNAFAGSHDEAVYQPMVDLRLAQIYERKGDRPKALEHYAAFLRQWESADPDALPLVDQARAAMTRLRAQ